jgi:nucleoside phosphorylase
MAPSSLSHGNYTVAWISALPHEMAAGRTMLDEIHPNLAQRSGDTNSYTLGSISGHNVVMVCLPSIGTNSAAAAVNHLRSSFPNVQYGLMVGIGGGVPSEKADIRLGDIVVSKPVDKYPGVVQYDFGKSVAGGRFEQTGTLNRPPEILLGAMASLEAQYPTLHEPISTIVTERLARNGKMASFRCPGPEGDQLFESSYDHPEFEDDCSQCDIDRLVRRESRSTTEPYIWYGLIASGNQVMKDGPARDALSSKFPVLCFEMEAAGLMNYLPCLVVRGICDYCDSHKKKKWQGYAAITAAAYATLLLSRVPRAVPSLGESSSK